MFECNSHSTSSSLAVMIPLNYVMWSSYSLSYTAHRFSSDELFLFCSFFIASSKGYCFVGGTPLLLCEERIGTYYFSYLNSKFASMEIIIKLYLLREINI